MSIINKFGADTVFMTCKPYFLKFLFLFFVLLLSCNKRQKANIELDFTHVDNFDEAYSLSFNVTDTISLRQYWKANDVSDSSKNYIAIIDDSQRNKLEKLVKKINIQVLHEGNPEYATTDGIFTGLYLKNDLQNATIIPYNGNEAREINELVEYIISFKKTLKLQATDNQFNFKSAPKIPTTIQKQRTNLYLPE
ncbi:hypothetical protein ACFP1I_30445 [Dyadobacter subterraneus]|uniref:Uncharacterized protein n=1 Tax=Dyadobacter subterraneus TaxID=2773304 RepID=A0ABR9W844_9BACT|nr:hypothetical protein [Dyadobacter subterraneus]MBE9461638.1 hypothetical protein [Dyadobacter subterraneus]